MSKTEDLYYLPEEAINEKVFVSFHKRTPTQMSTVHKTALNDRKHTVLHHETTGNGSHVIHHLTPAKKVRTTTIGPAHGRKGLETKVEDRPASPENQKKFGILK